MLVSIWIITHLKFNTKWMESRCNLINISYLGGVTPCHHEETVVFVLAKKMDIFYSQLYKNVQDL